MFRNLTFATTLLGAVAISGAASSQVFSNVYVFGDSLSDAGNFAPTQGLPAGTSFTTNPDPVWAEIVAQGFGRQAAPSSARGTNSAWGGSCVNPSGACTAARTYKVPEVSEQISQHLAATSGRADPWGLYMIWAGGNDVEAIANAALANPSSAPGEISAAATSYVQQVARLKQAGAGRIVVLTVPNPGRTPFAQRAAAVAPTVPASLAQIGQGLNQGVVAGLRQLGDGIIFVDVAALADEVFEEPAAYGFTSPLGVACPFGSNPARPEGGAESIVCGPRESGYIVAPDTSETYFFADGVHPSGTAHELIANAVSATVSAPLQVSLATVGGYQITEAHRRIATEQIASDLGRDDLDGGLRTFASGWVGTTHGGSIPGQGKPGGGMLVGAFGANFSAGPDVAVGTTVSYGSHNYDLAGASLGSDGFTASVQMAMQAGVVTLTGDVSYGQTSVDIDRKIALGSATRIERGATKVSSTGANLNLAIPFGLTGGFVHGPFGGMTLLNQEVAAYREAGTNSTAMNFSGFSRDSLIARLGYQLTGIGLEGGTARPYVRVAFERELEETPVVVTGASNALPGRFALPSGLPENDWISADIGITAQISDRARAFATFSGRFGDESISGQQIGVGINVAF